MHKPKLAITMWLVLLVTNLLTMFFNQLNDSIFVFPSHLYEPLQWYRTLTHALYGGGLKNWVFLTFIGVGSGFVIEPVWSNRQLWAMIVGSTIAGGFAYMVLHQLDDFDPPMATPGFIAWAYLAASLVTGLFGWKGSGWFTKVWVVVAVLIFANQILGNTKLKTEVILVSVGAVIYALYVNFMKKGSRLPHY